MEDIRRKTTMEIISILTSMLKKFEINVTMEDKESEACTFTEKEASQINIT